MKKQANSKKREKSHSQLVIKSPGLDPGSYRSNFVLSLEETALILHNTNGNVHKAAEILNTPNHTLQSFIEKHANLQAICLNRDIEIKDKSKDLVLELLDDENISYVMKIPTAKWALEKLDVNYAKKLDIKQEITQHFDNMSVEELEQYKKELLERFKSEHTIELEATLVKEGNQDA